MKKLKCYIDLPWRRNYCYRHKLSHVTIGAGVSFDWYLFQFSRYDDGSFYPKGQKEGDHVFTISFGLLNWSLSIVFYKN